MDVVVCIKQVPDTMEVQIDPKTNTLQREGVAAIINPFDMYAIEEALRLREKVGGRVTALTMGPPQAASALREALAMGVDEAVLLSDRAFIGSDTWATGYTLAMAIKEIKDFDIILCGKQASDGDTAQVGPGISAHLDIPQVTYVKKIEDIKDKTISVERMTEEGYDVVQTTLPCLLTVVKEINEPRLPSLKGMMRAKKAPIISWTAADLEADPDLLGLNGSPTQVVKVFTPPPRPKGQIFDTTPEEAASQLVTLLKDQL